jgi:sec-independent protein translocase protein TatB
LDVFNLSGSEIFFLLLIGLVVLGPEKLPEAMRKFGRVYQEVRKVAGGMQSDLRQTFEDPANEMRKTAEQAKRIFSGQDIADSHDALSSSDQHDKEPVFVPYEAPDQPAEPNPAEPNPSEPVLTELSPTAEQKDAEEAVTPKPTEEA